MAKIEVKVVYVEVTWFPCDISLTFAEDKYIWVVKYTMNKAHTMSHIYGPSKGDQEESIHNRSC